MKAEGGDSGEVDDADNSVAIEFKRGMVLKMLRES